MGPSFTDGPSARNKPEVLETEENTFLTLMTLLTSSHQLISECHGKAILDTGCTATVAGLAWLNDYLRRIPEAEKVKVSYC